eukprot:gene17122-20357_t
MELFSQFSDHAHTKHVLDKYNESEELVISSISDAENINQNLIDCPSGAYPITVIIEKVEHLTGGDIDNTFEVTWDVYSLNETLAVASVEELGEASASNKTYAAQLFSVEQGTDTTYATDSFLYILGPCRTGCFRPHYSGDGIYGCVYASLTTDDSVSQIAMFNNSCLAAPQNAALDTWWIYSEQELRDGLAAKVAGESHFVIEADITMASADQPFEVNGGGPLDPGLPRRVLLTSGAGCVRNSTSGEQLTRCAVDGSGITPLFEFGADRDSSDILHNEVLVVDGLVLTNGTAAEGCGGALRLRRGSLVILRNTLVLGNRAGRGGVICGVPSIYTTYRALFTESEFLENHALELSSSSSSRRRKLLSHTTTNSAGVALCGYCTLVVRGCLVKNNTAEGNGGVLYLDWRNSIWLYDTIFMQNSQGLEDGSLSDGGVIAGSNYNNGSLYIEGCNFDRNSAQVYGGAIAITDSSLWVVNSSFVSNVALGLTQSAVAGAVYLSSGYGARRFPAVLDGCTFAENMAQGVGGAIMIADSMDPEYAEREHVLIHSTFINNTADDGGAVAIECDQSFHIHSCNLLDNSARIRGGAMSLGTVTTSASFAVTIESSSFSRNAALE